MADILDHQEATDCAKNFENFQGVYMAVTLHPEWLTEVPDKRRWAILHHVVYSGNIDNLEQLLALQKCNPRFLLLAKANDGQTVLDVAKLRDDQPKMLKHIERLVKLDEMLNYAKDTEWDKCYKIVKANPSYGNEKPAYRRFYLIHHMACVNAIKEFERFKKIEDFKFNLTLRADKKKINTIAREYEGQEFAEYIEKEFPAFFEDDEKDDKLYEPSAQSKEQTNKVNIIMVQRPIFHESELSLGPAPNIMSRKEIDKAVKDKLAKQPQSKAGAAAVARSGNKPDVDHPMEAIRSILMCSLTHAIVTDPVVAADGFTYERSAIENWLRTNDHSPMTNEKLAHKNLNPNIVVKQILSTLTPQ